MMQLATQRRGERDLAGLVARNPHDDGLRRIGGEDFPQVANTLALELHARHGLRQIQFAAILLHVAADRKVDGKIAQRLVALVVRAVHVALDEPLCGPVVAGNEESANCGQRLQSVRVQVVVRLAGPERVLVQIDSLLFHAAPNHAAESAIANHGGLRPASRRATMPERERLPRSLHGALHGRTIRFDRGAGDPHAINEQGRQTGLVDRRRHVRPPVAVRQRAGESFVADDESKRVAGMRVQQETIAAAGGDLVDDSPDHAGVGPNPRFEGGALGEIELLPGHDRQARTQPLADDARQFAWRPHLRRSQPLDFHCRKGAGVQPNCGNLAAKGVLACLVRTDPEGKLVGRHLGKQRQCLEQEPRGKWKGYILHASVPISSRTCRLSVSFHRLRSITPYGVAKRHEGLASFGSGMPLRAARNNSMGMQPCRSTASWNCRSLCLPGPTISSWRARICRPPIK